MAVEARTEQRAENSDLHDLSPAVTMKYLCELMTNIGTFRCYLSEDGVDAESGAGGSGPAPAARPPAAPYADWCAVADTSRLQFRGTRRSSRALAGSVERAGVEVSVALPPGLRAARCTSASKLDCVEAKVAMPRSAPPQLLGSGEGALSRALECSEAAPLKLYCRHCSADLVPGGITSAQLLPSPDWREVAEQLWFCGGCCGGGDDGEATSALLEEWEQRLVPAARECLLGGSVCVLRRQDAAALRLCPAPPLSAPPLLPLTSAADATPLPIDPPLGAPAEPPITTYDVRCSSCERTVGVANQDGESWQEAQSDGRDWPGLVAEGAPATGKGGEGQQEGGEGQQEGGEGQQEGGEVPVVTVFLHSVSGVRGGSGAGQGGVFAAHTVERTVAWELLRARRARSALRFHFHAAPAPRPCDTTSAAPPPVLQLAVLSADCIVAFGDVGVGRGDPSLGRGAEGEQREGAAALLCGAAGAQYWHAVKVMYREEGAGGAGAGGGAGGTGAGGGAGGRGAVVQVPREERHELAAALHASSAHLPLSARHFQGHRIGFLRLSPVASGDEAEGGRGQTTAGHPADLRTAPTAAASPASASGPAPPPPPPPPPPDGGECIPVSMFHRRSELGLRMGLRAMCFDASCMSCELPRFT